MSAKRASGEPLSMRLLRLLAEHPEGLMACDCAVLMDSEAVSTVTDRCAAKLRWLEVEGYAQRKDATATRGLVWMITPAGTERLSAGGKRRSRGITHGTRYAYTKALCRCDRCREWQHQYFQRYRAKHPELTAYITEHSKRWRAANPEKAKAKDARELADKLALNAELAAEARKRGRHWQQWTGPELEIAAREDLTAVQVARMIGRSALAVACARDRLRKEPKLQALAGLGDRSGRTAR